MPDAYFVLPDIGDAQSSLSRDKTSSGRLETWRKKRDQALNRTAKRVNCSRAMRSHAKYIEFCRCLLDDDGHQCWRDILEELGVADPGGWMRYAARFATLPPLSAQLALPVPVWSIVSSTVLLHLQPSLLAALAARMEWPIPLQQYAPVTMHFAGYSAGSYTAIALEADYRLLCRQFQQPCCDWGPWQVPFNARLAVLVSKHLR